MCVQKCYNGVNVRCITEPGLPGVMTHLWADHQLGDTVHHGDCCCGDRSLLVPICALQPEREGKRGGCAFCGLCICQVLGRILTEKKNNVNKHTHLNVLDSALFTRLTTCTNICRNQSRWWVIWLVAGGPELLHVHTYHLWHAQDWCVFLILWCKIYEKSRLLTVP